MARATAQLIFYAVMLMLAAELCPTKVLAAAQEKDLKSDLELEIDGYKDKSQPETAVKRPAPPALVPLSVTPAARPISRSTPRPLPAPLPTATPQSTPQPTPLPQPTATPNPVAAVLTPISRPVAPARPAAHAPPVVAERKFSSGNDLQRRMELAQIQIDKKQYEQAVDTLKPVIDALPRTGLLLLARAYSGVNDRMNELKVLELCIAKNPKDYVVQTSYGIALLRVHRSEDGLAAFQEARTLNPRYQPAYDAALNELEHKGERYESRNLLMDEIKVFGPQPVFYTTLCRLYALDDYNEKSIEVCQDAIDKSPKTPENHVYLGLALKNRDQADKATQVLTQAAKRFPASEQAQSAMAELYYDKKDFVSAYNYYKRAATADPKSARAWVGYGNTAFELQKNDEALRAFVNGCKVDRQQIREFRSAIGKLRVRHDATWQSKFEMGINECQ